MPIYYRVWLGLCTQYRMTKWTNCFMAYLNYLELEIEWLPWFLNKHKLIRDKVFYVWRTAQNQTHFILVYLSRECEREWEWKRESARERKRDIIFSDDFSDIFSKFFFSYMFIYIQQTNQLHATMSLLFRWTDSGMAKENERFIWIEENIPSVMDFESEKLK